MLLQASRGSDLQVSTLEDQARPWTYQWRSRAHMLWNEPTKSKVWRALGENWWMAYLDGKDHWKGKHGYDHVVDGAQDVGSFYENEEREYNATFTSNDWDVRWNATKLAQLNGRLRSKACTSPNCDDLFAGGYDPGQEYWKLHPAVPTPLPVGSSAMERKSKMDELLITYYHNLDTIISAEGGDLVSAFPQVLPIILEMYSQIALLHAFGDGNSRTRTAFLQTELVKHGGHPVMLQDNGWFVYYVGDMSDMLMEFLKGWCTWEIATITGSSPFVSASALTLEHYNRSYDTVSESCQMPI